MKPIIEGVFPVDGYLMLAKCCMGKRLPTMYKFLELYGRRFQAQKRPKQYPKEEDNQCYQNAFELAFNDPNLTYVEGLAHSVIVTEHAWVVDNNGRVIDNTWLEPGADYFGVPLKIEYVSSIICGRGYYGVFDDLGESPIYKDEPALFLHSIANKGIQP